MWMPTVVELTISLYVHCTPQFLLMLSVHTYSHTSCFTLTSYLSYIYIAVFQSVCALGVSVVQLYSDVCWFVTV